MSVKSIGSVVNASFIRSFQGLAGSDGPSIGAGAGQAASVYSGLRLGARTFGTAIQNLNSAIGVVNLADSALKKLSEVVDGMISLTEKATSVSAGTETRRKLQSEFDDLVDEFRNVVAGSQIFDIDYLTEEGLANLFQRVGLDQETSEGVAAVLAKFIKPESEDSFASEDTKASRPVNVPVLKKSKVLQETNESSGVLIQDTVQISPDYSVYTDSAYNTYTVDSSGTKSSINSNGFLVMNESLGDSVGEVTGYMAGVNTTNPLGHNPSGRSNAFLIAPDGTYIRQITNNSSASVLYDSFGLSSDNKTALVGYLNFSGGSAALEVISVADINDAPASATVQVTIPTAWPFGVTGAALSNDGNQVVYETTSNEIYWQEVGGANTNTGITSPLAYGFADSNNLVTLNSAGTEISVYNINSAASTTLIVDQNITKLAVLEVDPNFSVNDGSSAGTPKVAAIAYITNTDGNNRLTVLNYDTNSGNLKTRFRRDLGQGTVDDISLAYQNDRNTSKDRVDVGVSGALPSLFGDSDGELYRIKEAKFATNSSLFSAASSDPSSILDGNLYTRADTYRMLADLKALKSQIGDNLDALNETRDYIRNNVELIRTAGFAFLDISNQLNGLEEAEQVAKMVASEIRKNASRAQAAQVENLSSIVSQTTALLDSSS